MNNNERPKWDNYFSAMAHLVASRSSCNSAKVGAVIVKDHRMLATDYNGSLPGQPNCCDTPDRCMALEKEGKKYDNCPAVHAEANAVAQAAKYGISISGAEIYVTRTPCLICAKLLAAAGIVTIIIADDEYLESGELTWFNAPHYVEVLMESKEQ